MRWSLRLCTLDHEVPAFRGADQATDCGLPILEVLLGTFRLSAALPAIATSVIAALVAWIGLGDDVQYPVMAFAISPSLVVWSIATGPIFGVAAYGFTRMAAMPSRSSNEVITNWLSP